MSRRTLGIAALVAAAVILAAVLVMRGPPPRQSVEADSTIAPASSQAAPAGPPATVDRAEYDARMRALANLGPPCKPEAESAPAESKAETTHRTTPAIEDAATGRAAHGKPAPARKGTKKPVHVRYRPCPAPLWPVKTALPEAGALLPFHRIVAYYGNYYSKQMGILGEYPPAEVLAKLQDVVAEWKAADPSTPVIPALDYIAVSAQAAPGKDGMYRLRMPATQIAKAVQMADQVHGLVFLDVQPGWSTLAAELPRLEPYLKLPNVELALDPEFALVPGKRPGAWRGTMSAAQINFAAQWLARIVEQNHIAPKILIVHRFTERMVTGYHGIQPLPQVQIVMDMDGFGSPSLKTDAYHSFITKQPVQFAGFKLFYKNDVKWGGRLMTPAQILALSPRPIYIVYQ